MDGEIEVKVNFYGKLMALLAASGEEVANWYYVAADGAWMCIPDAATADRNRMQPQFDKNIENQL